MQNKDSKTEHTANVSIDETSTIRMISAELEEVEDVTEYAKSTTEEIMLSNTPISTETAVYETTKTGTYTHLYTSEENLENQQGTKNTNEDIHNDEYSLEDENTT